MRYIEIMVQGTAPMQYGLRRSSSRHPTRGKCRCGAPNVLLPADDQARLSYCPICSSYTVTMPDSWGFDQVQDELLRLATEGLGSGKGAR